MEEAREKGHLIENMRAAVVALCLTGFIFAQGLWAAFRHHQHGSYSIFDTRAILPASAAAVVNLAFYAYLLWLGMMLYRNTQGKERVIVAGWFTFLFLGGIQNLVSISAAAAINWLKAASILVALLAAVNIAMNIQRLPKSNGISPC